MFSKMGNGMQLTAPHYVLIGLGIVFACVLILLLQTNKNRQRGIY
ncbi:hypothetical protein LCGC14_1406050, partial [marine sediment metagenome]